MNYDIFATLMTRQGRNDGPMLLNEHWPALSADDRKLALLDAWITAEWPTLSIPWEIWLIFFKQTGFISDNPDIKKPLQPLTIYRGAAKHKKKGMSWTQDKELAVWFANRFKAIGKSYLYTTDIEPDYILAIITGETDLCRSGESEVIVNPEGLNNIKRLELTRQE